MMLEAFDIRQVWDSVLPGLSYIKENYDPEWRPEDLYAGCVAKRMHLFKPNAQSSDFVLLSTNVSVYTGAASLLVLVAYSKEGDAVETYQSEIDRIARESGCSLIDFYSPRLGWERHGKRFGYEPKATMFRRMI
jgi:hypothetical protein